MNGKTKSDMHGLMRCYRRNLGDVQGQLISLANLLGNADEDNPHYHDCKNLIEPIISQLEDVYGGLLSWEKRLDVKG